ncbi:MAG: biopolymer transporter ExbD [Muribaculaceae bacterium]|nr:biopolymer transporter ExbD [Muribaculaceae bacterium]
MALKRQHKTQAMFSMSSMTDVIFLLLIFFMVTSTFVQPSEIEVNLPQSTQQAAIRPTTSIYIKKEGQIYWVQTDTTGHAQTDSIANPDQLLGLMRALKASDPDQFVALHADTLVHYGQIVDVLDRGSQAGLRIVLATTPRARAEAAPEVQPVAAEPASQPEPQSSPQ